MRAIRAHEGQGYVVLDKRRMDMKDVYDSYVDKVNWDRSERLHAWNAGRMLHLLATTAHLAPAESSLLEIGTGSGRVARAAVAAGWKHYEGVEPTRALRKLAISQQPDLVLHDAALPELPGTLQDGFDAVMAVHVLEHAPDPYAARSWLAAMTECLKPASADVPGGALLIASPDLRDYKSTFWEVDWSHGWPTTPARVADLMRDVGLEPFVVRNMRLGSLSPWAFPIGKLASGLLPTRPLDAFSRRAVGRPLATGLKITFLWGLTFVVGRVPTGKPRNRPSALQDGQDGSSAEASFLSETSDRGYAADDEGAGG